MFDPALVKNVAGAGQQRNMLPERQEFAMAVLVIFRAKGNSQDLLARYDATLADAIATAPARPEAHFCASTGDGIMIVDVWSSRAEVQRAIIDNQDFQRKWKDAGWPDETVEMFEVHSTGWPK
jgi:hypothetical protein